MGFLPSFPNSAVLVHKLFQKYFQKKKKVNGEHTILSELRGSELNKLIALEMMYFHILPNKSILLRNVHKKSFPLLLPTDQDITNILSIC